MPRQDRPLEGWTIYPARSLSHVPKRMAKKFDSDFERLKRALRKLGAKIYDFAGIKPAASAERTCDYDLMCVECADLVLCDHRLQGSGIGVEIAWKCALKGHVIVGAPKHRYVSKMICGFKVRNPNFEFVRYKDILDLVPIVLAHFAGRQRPGPKAPPLEQFPDPTTQQSLFRQKKIPVAT